MFSSRSEEKLVKIYEDKAVAMYELTVQQLIENQRVIVPSVQTIVVILES